MLGFKTLGTNVLELQYVLCWQTMIKTVRLNLFNHVLVLFHAKFAYNLAIRYPVFGWDSCKGSVWESVKKTQMCALKKGLTIGSRDWWVAKGGTRVKHAGELKAQASCSTTGQNFQSGQAISLQLKFTTCSSCEVESLECPVWLKHDFLHSSYTLL